MLVLSRFREEGILVVDGERQTGVGEIKVVDFRGDKVRLGLNMASRYNILRDEAVKNKSMELYNAIREGKALTPDMIQQLQVLYRGGQ